MCVMLCMCVHLFFSQSRVYVCSCSAVCRPAIGWVSPKAGRCVKGTGWGVSFPPRAAGPVKKIFSLTIFFSLYHFFLGLEVEKWYRVISLDKALNRQPGGGVLSRRQTARGG